jgi:hypothetical protein
MTKNAGSVSGSALKRFNADPQHWFFKPHFCCKRLELENKHLKQELETAKTHLAKKEKETQRELENESKRLAL